MNEKALNGSAEAAPAAIQLRRTIIPHGAGQKIVYTMSDGAYLGCVVHESMNTDALKVMAQDFHDFVAQSCGGLMVARGALPKTQ
jgi:hypothetical protein